MNWTELDVSKGGTHHCEWELEKHEQRERWEDDVGGQGCRGDISCSGEGAECDKDWKKLSIRGVK